ATVVSVPAGVMVQTPVVDEEKVTDRSELAVATRVGEVPKFCVPGLLNVTAWLAMGVTLLEFDEAAPVPAELLAVTVKE
ncbi:MAG: hypothetical protein V4587_19460, partial [Acidobacteriota bacterium]